MPNGYRPSMETARVPLYKMPKFTFNDFVNLYNLNVICIYFFYIIVIHRHIISISVIIGIADKLNNQNTDRIDLSLV